MTRRYPVVGKTKESLKLLDKADYVEYSEFSGSCVGYFCSTCQYYVQDKPSRGQCTLLDMAPVRSFGCCNFWQLAQPGQGLTADGKQEW